MNHDPDCTGGHVEAISCAEVAALRAKAAANPWYCPGVTNSGYHRFSANPAPDEECRHYGCFRTWGELQ